jgi:membrane protease YdiL (CAAX protease family)
MGIPFWFPGLWIAGSLLAMPGHIWLTILGYHALCLIGSVQAGAWRIGKSGRAAWLFAALSTPLLAIPLLLPAWSAFPKLQITLVLGQWPGGLWSHAVYALLVNVPVEEAYWRGAVLNRHPHWSSVQHGAAFGLHHAVAVAILLPWPWIVPAFLGPMVVGAIWTWLARKTRGIAFPALSHAIADFSLILLAARQLS